MNLVSVNFATLFIFIIVVAICLFGLMYLKNNKKISIICLNKVVSCLCSNEDEILKLLKLCVNTECLQKSNTYEEFIENVLKEVQQVIYSYIQNNFKCIPDQLLKYATYDNMEYIAEQILAKFGYDKKSLGDIFIGYIEDLANIESDKDEKSETLEIASATANFVESKFDKPEVKSDDNINLNENNVQKETESAVDDKTEYGEISDVLDDEEETKELDIDKEETPSSYESSFQESNVESTTTDNTYEEALSSESAFKIPDVDYYIEYDQEE
jgi:hypothetical protein